MELYILDDSLRRVEVVDMFESLIWAERFDELGDFKLKIRKSSRLQEFFAPGTRLALNTSYRVMVIDSVETTSDDGKEYLQIAGTSIEKIINDRVGARKLPIFPTPPAEVAPPTSDPTRRTTKTSFSGNAATGIEGTVYERPEITSTVKGTVALNTAMVIEGWAFAEPESQWIRPIWFKIQAGWVIATSYTNQNRSTLKDLNSDSLPKWKWKNKPAIIARSMYNHICLDGMLSPNDIITMVNSGGVFPGLPPSSIPEPDTEVELEVTIGPLYEQIQAVCKMFEMGVRIVRDDKTASLYFEIYMGSDRTTQQSTLPPVIFSTDLDNLNSTSEYVSNKNLKNIAYVVHPDGFAFVASDGTSLDVTNFGRNVLFVDASDIKLEPGDNLQTLLNARGVRELSKHQVLWAFDGEISKNSPYVYGVHYNVGDLIEIRNNTGFTNTMRVMEQIFVSDAEGERSYPTLAINKLITPGSWLGWDYNGVWANAVGTWAEQ